MLKELDTRINRNTYIPFYIQIIDSIVDYIEVNELPPGYKLPPESELCQSYNVSRTVVRQALNELVHKGLITRVKGKGTFISEPKIHESLFHELTGFYQDMEKKGLEPKSKVLEQELIPASKKVSMYLEIPENETVIMINRLRFINDEPIVLVTTYLPYSMVPDLIEVDLSNISLYVYLENECGLQIARGKRFLEAVPANQLEAENLNIGLGSPLLMLDSVSYLADGQPIEYFHALHRGDRSRFETELVRVSQPKDLAKKIRNDSTP